MIGGRLRPYPWREVRSVRRRMIRGRRLRAVAIGAAPIAALLSPVALVALAWSWRGYRRRNDSWWLRSASTLLAGIVITMIDFRLQPWLAHSADVLAGSVPLRFAVDHLFLGAVGPSLIVAAASAAGLCYAHEWAAHRYLDSTRPGLVGRLRKARNTAALRSGDRGDGQVRFGVIVDDPVPWRTPRHGLIARRRARELGPGLIVGGIGTGTTVTAVTLADQMVADATVIYLDCDGSELTRSRLRAVAERHRVPYTSFDLGVGTDDSRWYDPLSWVGPPEQRTVALLAALGRRTDLGGIATPAQGWLDLQHEVLDEIGLRPDESRFDFLIETADPVRLHDRFRHHAYGTPDQQRLHEHWTARLATLPSDELVTIQDDLMTLINAAGPRLRPAHPGDEPLRLTHLEPTPGVIHIGLGAASDGELTRRVIGGLVLQDLAALLEYRRRSGEEHHDLVVIIDSADRLGDRMAAGEMLVRQGSAVGIHCWSVTHSLRDLPAEMVESCLAEAESVIIHRVTDVETAERLSAHIGRVPAIAGPWPAAGQRRGALLGRRSGLSGVDVRGLSSTALVPDELLWSLPDHHAFVIFSGTAATGDWRSRRVPADDIDIDAPQCLIVPARQVLHPQPPKDAPAPTFADLVAPAGDLAHAGGAPADVPLSEAQRRRLAEYRARRAEALRDQPDAEALPDDPATESDWGVWVPDDGPGFRQSLHDQQAVMIATTGLAKPDGPATDDPFRRHDGQREAAAEVAEWPVGTPESDSGADTESSRDLATDMSETPVLEAPPDDGTSGNAQPIRRRRTGRTTTSTPAGHEPRSRC